MDEMKLKKILQDMPVPPADDNASKRALNLAVAEFKSLENNKKKSTPNIYQGIPFLSRLISKTTQTRRDPVEQASKRKLMYGGMATAMAVVLIAGVTFTQYQTGPISGATVSDAQLKKVQFAVEEPVATEGNVASVLEEAPKQLAQTKDDKNADEDRVDAAAIAPTTPPMNESSGITMEQQQNLPQAMPAPTGTRPYMAGKTKATSISHAAEKKESYAAPESLNANMAAGASATAEMDARVMMIAPAQDAIAPIDPASMPPGYHDVGRDNFKDFEVSPVKLVASEPVSTFSIDVDTSSYSFMRSQLNSGVLPQKDAVRVEEMVNYFDYNYPLPEAKDEPFKPSITVTPSPWSDGKKLVHIGIKGYDIEKTTQPHSNIVFLLDVSGSMDEPNKLPLLKNSIKLLLDTLRPDDKVAIVVYAGAAGTVLEPTNASEKTKIIAAIENLNAGGGTAGAEGINLAYQLAEQNFDKEGVNRVILATDGDFNVGITSEEELQDFVERKRETGIFLSVLGFGQGNYNDSMMQTLAQNGNGTAAYIDTLNEARKVLVEESSSTLFTIAKDVKIQVEFNPALVSEYRLVGYETRALNREDFNNDKVDAGDIGAGHAVTAIYEITPAGAPTSVDTLRYGTVDAAKPAPSEVASNFSNELGFLKLRYKLPNESVSELITTPIVDNTCPPDAKCQLPVVSEDVNWAVAVAGFAQLLKGDKHIGNWTYDDVINLAQANKGADTFGQRAEFINLVRLAKTAPAAQ